MIKGILLGLGILGIFILLCIVILLPFLCTLILGTYIATTLGLTGIVWWSFVILFYLVLMGIIGML